ncbi:Phosphoenolpyruvate synthase [compost metagenome]
MKDLILNFSEIGIRDIAAVGGKNASLGEMYRNLVKKGLRIPNGYAITVAAFSFFLEYNKLTMALQKTMDELDTKDFNNLSTIGSKARKMLMDGKFPRELESAIILSYKQLCGTEELAVAVRSSATAEDLADASFAGQHDSYLNIKGTVPLMFAIKCCFASLYTDRAIKYRQDKGYEHHKVYLSVGIQQMVRSDIGCSGIGFTLEPESGFRNVVHLAGIWGLGETIVQGSITPDEFLVFKPSLHNNKKAILQKTLGSKTKMMVYDDNPAGTNSTRTIVTPRELKNIFILNNAEIEQLARWSLIIEDHYGKPMDFEWAKDGHDKMLYIIQARPETVHSQIHSPQLTSYTLEKKGTILTKGEAIGSAIISGCAKLLSSPAESGELKAGDILITDTTSPDWDPILKKVSGIVTNKGGRTSHASIVARELGTVAVVGTGNATAVIKNGDIITISCAEGKTGIIYAGKLKYVKNTLSTEGLQLPQRPRAQLIIAEPDRAFELSFYPNDGIGLLRLEFIFTNSVKIHPMALVYPEKVTDLGQRSAIDTITHAYSNKKEYLIDTLSQGVATIAAAFYPKEVIVRMSDFKSNEYAGLLGGTYFEPTEDNPMLGFRGASRYYHKQYREGFQLECEAMKMVRDEMGMTNVKLMIPFCRTPQEGEKVIALMAEYGLVQNQNGLEIYMMCEIPSNVILAPEFSKIFDGFSIGSNDLTQLTLGVDRDSSLIAGLFDEENQAVEQMILQMIQAANKTHKKIGLCGQAPSDSPSFTKFLVKAGIDTIAFNPDALIRGIKNINDALSHKIQNKKT